MHGHLARPVDASYSFKISDSSKTATSATLTWTPPIGSAGDYSVIGNRYVWYTANKDTLIF